MGRRDGMRLGSNSTLFYYFRLGIPNECYFSGFESKLLAEGACTCIHRCCVDGNVHFCSLHSAEPWRAGTGDQMTWHDVKKRRGKKERNKKVIIAPARISGVEKLNRKFGSIFYLNRKRKERGKKMMGNKRQTKKKKKKKKQYKRKRK